MHKQSQSKSSRRQWLKRAGIFVPAAFGILPAAGQLAFPRARIFKYSAPAASTSEFLASAAGSTARSNFTQYIGFRFTVRSGSSLVVTHLGRWVIAQSAYTRTVGIFKKNGSAWDSLGSVSIDLSTATAGAMNWAALGSSLTIDASSICAVGSNEVSGEAQWYDRYAVTWNTGAGNTVYSVYRNAENQFIDNEIDKAYVMTNFKYET